MPGYLRLPLVNEALKKLNWLTLWNLNNVEFSPPPILEHEYTLAIKSVILYV